jgi:hypothetical protein
MGCGLVGELRGVGLLFMHGSRHTERQGDNGQPTG